MTTISGTSAYQTFAAQRPSPPPSGKDRLTAAIDSEASTGSISRTDATALTSALDTIDSSLSADAGSSASSGRAARLDPAEMQDRIDDLIADQVSSGALTEDQADTLSDLFAQQGDEGGPEAAGGGMAGPGKAGGPPPGPPPGDGPGGTDATSEASAGNSASDLLASFIEQLKAAQSGGAGYAASGQSGSQQASALLFDFKA